MPNGDDIQRALQQPLVALEQLLLAPVQALQQGINQLNATATRSGLPQLPELPEAPTPPRLFSGSSHNPGGGIRIFPRMSY